MTKHKHKWLPTTTGRAKINDDFTAIDRDYILIQLIDSGQIDFFERKWICICGKSKWVKER